METTKKTIGQIIDSGEYLLPIGFVDKDEVVHHTFTLGYMNGEVDEAISEPTVKDNGGRIITEALTKLVKNLGTIKNVKKEHIRAMQNGDRDFLIVMNYIQSLATDEFIRWTESCTCKRNFDVEKNYRELNVNFLTPTSERTVDVVLPSGIVTSEGTFTNIKLSLPNGEAQEKVAIAARENVAKAQTQFLVSVLEEVEGLSNWTFETVRMMMKKDRTVMMEAVNGMDAGVDMMVKVECPNCARKFTTGIPLGAILGE